MDPFGNAIIDTIFAAGRYTATYNGEHLGHPLFGSTVILPFVNSPEANKAIAERHLAEIEGGADGGFEARLG